ncbi:MAG: carboxylesterase, partial [Acidobacteria bacterium]
MRTAYAFLLSVALSAATASAQIVETPVPGDPVALDSGLVSRKVLASGVRAYLGVPFAEPPVRELRWREPKPVRPWTGVYHADRKPAM